MKFIDLSRELSLIRDDLMMRIGKVLDSTRFINADEVVELERKLADYTGSRNCIAVSSGTDALFISLLAIGIKPEDEIITTPFTFMATTGVILQAGAIPVYADIDLDSYNIDPEKIEPLISKKTKAIMAVDLYGQPADYDKINAIADKYNLVVIEDAAQSFGSRYKAKRAGSLARIAATSFFPTKPLGCYGDGGAIFTDDDDLAKIMRSIREHGHDEKPYNHVRVGLNGRLDSLQAAVLLSKLSLFDEQVALREEKGRYYTDRLKDIVKVPFVMAGNSHVYAQYTLYTKKRDRLIEYLSKLSIPTAIHYSKPIHLQPVMEKYRNKIGSLPVAEDAASHVMSLPFYPYIRNDEQDLIIEAIRKGLS